VNVTETYIITLLLKFINNHEMQVRSPVSRYCCIDDTRKTC